MQRSRSGLRPGAQREQFGYGHPLYVALPRAGSGPPLSCRSSLLWCPLCPVLAGKRRVCLGKPVCALPGPALCLRPADGCPGQSACAGKSPDGGGGRRLRSPGWGWRPRCRWPVPAATGGGRAEPGSWAAPRPPPCPFPSVQRPRGGRCNDRRGPRPGAAVPARGAGCPRGAPAASLLRGSASGGSWIPARSARPGDGSRSHPLPTSPRRRQPGPRRQGEAGSGLGGGADTVAGCPRGWASLSPAAAPERAARPGDTTGRTALGKLVGREGSLRRSPGPGPASSPWTGEAGRFLPPGRSCSAVFRGGEPAPPAREGPVDPGQPAQLGGRRPLAARLKIPRKRGAQPALRPGRPLLRSAGTRWDRRRLEAGGTSSLARAGAQGPGPAARGEMAGLQPGALSAGCHPRRDGAAPGLCLARGLPEAEC